MIHICHLPIDTTQSIEIAVAVGGVCFADGGLVGVDGARGIAKVAVDATEKIVGHHALVGIAPEVVIADEGLGDGIGRKRNVGLILGLESQQVVAHTLASDPVGLLDHQRVEHVKGRVWLMAHQCVDIRQRLVCLLVSTSCQQACRKEDDDDDGLGCFHISDTKSDATFCRSRRGLRPISGFPT